MKIKGSEDFALTVRFKIHLELKSFKILPKEGAA